MGQIEFENLSRQAPAEPSTEEDDLYRAITGQDIIPPPEQREPFEEYDAAGDKIHPDYMGDDVVNGF